jgi:hypothetical protein
MEYPDVLYAHLEYSTELFSAEHIPDGAALPGAIAGRGGRSKPACLSNSVVASSEQQKILYAWNRTARPIQMKVSARSL